MWFYHMLSKVSILDASLTLLRYYPATKITLWMACLRVSYLFSLRLLLWSTSPCGLDLEHHLSQASQVFYSVYQLVGLIRDLRSRLHLAVAFICGQLEQDIHEQDTRLDNCNTNTHRLGLWLLEIPGTAWSLSRRVQKLLRYCAWPSRTIILEDAVCDAANLDCFSSLACLLKLDGRTMCSPQPNTVHIVTKTQPPK